MSSTECPTYESNDYINKKTFINNILYSAGVSYNIGFTVALCLY